LYAIIRAGGKQHKVAKGDIIEVERVKESADSLEFVPLLVVDDKGKARSGKSDLASARVVASIVGESKGPKIDVVKYRNKTGYRRNTGHRQKYTTIQIDDIKLTAGKSSAKSGDSKASASKTDSDTKTATKTEEE
jgi:large subunit ribosomal protein L21